MPESCLTYASPYLAGMLTCASSLAEEGAAPGPGCAIASSRSECIEWMGLPVDYEPDETRAIPLQLLRTSSGNDGGLRRVSLTD